MLQKLETAQQSFQHWKTKRISKLHPKREVFEASALFEGIYGAGDSLWAIDDFGICQVIILLGQRLHVALGGSNSLAFESSAQFLSQDLDSLFTKHRHDPNFPKPGIIQSLSRATLATERDWREHCMSISFHNEPRRNDFITGDIFVRWLILAGVMMKHHCIVFARGPAHSASSTI